MQIDVIQQETGVFIVQSKLTGDTVLGDLTEDQTVVELECWIGYEAAKSFVRRAKAQRQGNLSRIKAARA